MKRKILTIVTIAFGASLASAMLNVTLDVGDQVNKELKAYGANIHVLPKMDTLPLEIGGIDFNPLSDQQFINEADLPKLKMIFWANNILSFAPLLETTATIKGSEDIKIVGTWFDKKLVIPTGETINVGNTTLKPWWEIKGKWATDDTNEALVGQEVAKQLGITVGDKIDLTFENDNPPLNVQVTGILNSGDEADGQLFVSLSQLQQVLNMAGKVQRIEVSALTTPENDLSAKADEDPETMTSEDFEKWYCTAYVNAITYQIEEVIPGVEAKPIRQVAQSEGAILSKIELLMILLTVAALTSSTLGVSGLMTTKVLERSKEIGLMKALGAEDNQIIHLFLSEALINSIFGGLIGYFVGLGFSAIIAREVFGNSLTIKPLVFPLILLISIGVVVLGSLSAVRYMTKVEPAHVLHGR